MKIVDNTAGATKRFTELKSGVCFRFDNMIWMKTNVNWDINNRMQNAVNLDSGRFIYIDTDRKVTPMDATLTLE